MILADSGKAQQTILRSRNLSYQIPMRGQDPIHESVGLVQLGPVPRARNDNTPCLKRGDSDLLTAPHGRAVALPRTEAGTRADACLIRIGLIVIVFGIDALINRRLQCARETVLLAQDPVKLGALNEGTHLVVGVEQLNRELLNTQRLLRNRLRESRDRAQHEVEDRLREVLTRDPRHLKSAISEQLDIDLFQLVDPFSLLSNDQSALIKEGLITHSALGKHITCRVSDYFCLMLHLHEALAHIADRNENVPHLLKELAQVNRGPEMPRGHQSGNTKRCKG